MRTRAHPAHDRARVTVPRSAPCHGPVARLADHLPDEWWKGVFTELYLVTDGDVVENPQNTADDVDALMKATGVVPSSRVLDLCCGQGRHTMELARRGLLAVTGVDQSAALLDVARTRALAQRLPVQFIQSDARNLPFAADQFDCVAVLGNSFGYFARGEDDGRMLREIGRVLSPGGNVVLDLSNGEYVRRTFQARSWEWIDRHRLVVRERQLSEDARRLVCREVVISTRQGVIVDQFYAETLYSADDLQRLLLENGFAEPTVHDTGVWASTRDQDLGMMAARMLVTATRQ